MNAPIFIDDYVRAAFHGLLLDELGPFDYFVSEADRDNQQAQAVDLMANDLATKYGRRLNMPEMVRLTIQVASEWQRQRQNEEERAGMEAIARHFRDGGGELVSERDAMRAAGRIP